MRRSLLVFALLALSTASARADTGEGGCHGNLFAELVAAASLIAVLALIGYTVMHFWRVRAARVAIAVPISLLVAERVARVVQRRSGVIAAIGVVGVPALVVMSIASLAVLSTIIGCIGLRGFFVARTVLQLIERAPAPTTAEVIGYTMFVRSGDDEVSLDVSAWALAAARRHAVPTSIAKQR